MSTFLLGDLQAIITLDAAIAAGKVDDPAVFEMFCRKLPEGRTYGVVAGAGRLISNLEDFRPDKEDFEWLHTQAEQGVISHATIQWLMKFEGFRGELIGYRDGDIYFARSPILTGSGSYGHLALIEGLALSSYNYDCAIAAAASVIRNAAGARRLVDMGTRRMHPLAAVDAARAAIIGGFDATSNNAASRRYGIPVAGTFPHNWVLSYGGPENEQAAFEAWFRKAGPNTTILIDTYDRDEGMVKAIRAFEAVFGPDEPMIFDMRSDGGAPEDACETLSRLYDTIIPRTGLIQVVLSGDWSEAKIKSFRYRFPKYDESYVKGYGVGTDLVIGGGYPTCGFVYKMVESNGKPVSKYDPVKGYTGGLKLAVRFYDEQGLYPVAERLYQDRAAVSESPTGLIRQGLQHVMCQGAPLSRDMPSATDAARLHSTIRETLLNPAYVPLEQASLKPVEYVAKGRI